jgi:hypothetical protein
LTGGVRVRRARVRRTIRAIFATILALTCARGASASIVDPSLRFRIIATPHFTIYFHQGEDRMASRLAAIAEETWLRLRPLNPAFDSRTHVVLVDQTELANGSAYPVPYDTITITAAWPAASDTIGLTDDWLRLVFTHEYTHILHLDRSAGWSRIVRGVFGRSPLAFPNLLLPTWQVEGLAVYEESRLDGQGRLHGGDFLDISAAARREGRFPPLDRVNGGLIDWPGGNAAYAYGAPFHQFLADRYGAGKLADLADATARAVPYTTSRAFERVFGKSLGELWRDFASLPAPPEPARGSAAPTRLTRHGFSTEAPRFAPPACDTCPPEIVYALVSPDAFPSLNDVSLDGTNDHAVTTRYLGSTTGVSRDLLVFDQQEYRRSAGLYSDLYVLDRHTGAVRALTREARLRDPDLSPDGSRIVCVREARGQRDLVIVDDWSVSPRTTTLAAAPETQFDAPRWSPDGRFIAVARHRLGAESEIVLVDAASGAIRVVASNPDTRYVTPAWVPDGTAIVTAGAREGEVFNLYEFAIGAPDAAPERGARAPRQLTSEPGGATWPDVSPDGRTLAYVGCTSAGYDVFTIAYPAPAASATESSSTAAMPRAAAASAASRAAVDPAAQDEPLTGGLPTPYSPWPTLTPAWWTPIFDNSSRQLRFGAATAAADVLGYHGYAASATWLVTHPAGVEVPGAATPDWQIAYAYARWQPVFFASASRDTSFFAGPPTETGAPTNGTLVEYQVETGVQWPFVHARVSHVAVASVVRATDRFRFASGTADVNRTALRIGWQTSTVHLFGYSISPEHGVTIAAAAEGVPKALGSTAGATTIAIETRGYVAGAGPHDVIALRAAAGSSAGNALSGRTFLLGGAGPAFSPLAFDSARLGLLRGFPADTFAGTHLVVGNADYRWPIAYVQRGYGTLPIFLRTLHAAVFADAANAWTRRFSASTTKTAVGLELSADIVAGYSLPFTVATGAAWGHDGAHLVDDGLTAYLRIGRAF